MVYRSTIDELAAEMEVILNDDSYRSVFERPRIKMASAKEPDPKIEKNTIESAYEQLVDASRILDELGLVKSSELALSAVEILLSEAAHAKCECPEDCPKCKCTEKKGEVKCVCLEDNNDADDAKCQCPKDCDECECTKKEGKCKCVCLEEKAKTTEVKPGEVKAAPQSKKA